MIVYETNTLTATDFLALRGTTGWGGATYEQVETALRRSSVTVRAVLKDATVGMGRLVGDGAIIWYVQDLIVLPEYQNRGIGRAMMQRLLDFVQENAVPGTNVMVGLMSAKGKEAFYEKLGFHIRPTDQEGAGMLLSQKVPLK